jgi:hypothetical protein
MALDNINIGSSANDGTGDNLRVAFGKINTNNGKVLEKSSTPSSVYATDGAGLQVMKPLSDFTIQVYKTVSTNTTLDNTYHSATVWVTATCNITIPSGLRSDFNCTFRTFTGVTATFLTSGTTINSESDGDVQAEKSMSYVAQYSTNNYIISGGGLS